MKIKNLTTLGLGTAALLTLSACGLYSDAPPAQESQPTQEITQPPALVQEVPVQEPVTNEVTQPELSRFSMDFLDVPYTLEEHLNFLGWLISSYNEIAPTIWLNNSVLDMYAIVKEVSEPDRLWLVYSDGTVSEISLQDAIARGLDEERIDMYHQLGDGRGYFTPIDVNNLNNWEVLHPSFAPTEVFRLGVHEGFHVLEQSQKWANASRTVFDFETFEMLVSEEEFAEFLIRVNAEREEFLEETDARVARRLLMRDLRLAVVNRDNEDYTLTALATYRAFRENFPQQHLISTDQDRSEGTATYFDFVAALNILFPNEVQTREGLDEALAYWMTYIDYENRLTIGLVLEGYYIGSLATMLLNRYVESDVWQQTIMDDYNVTSLSLLYDHFSGRSLPNPSVATQDFIDETLNLIERRRATFR